MKSRIILCLMIIGSHCGSYAQIGCKIDSTLLFVEDASSFFVEGDLHNKGELKIQGELVIDGSFNNYVEINFTPQSLLEFRGEGDVHLTSFHKDTTVIPNLSLQKVKGFLRSSQTLEITNEMQLGSGLVMEDDHHLYMNGGSFTQYSKNEANPTGFVVGSVQHHINKKRKYIFPVANTDFNNALKYQWIAMDIARLDHWGQMVVSYDPSDPIIFEDNPSCLTPLNCSIPDFGRWKIDVDEVEAVYHLESQPREVDFDCDSIESILFVGDTLTMIDPCLINSDYSVNNGMPVVWHFNLTSFGDVGIVGSDPSALLSHNFLEFHASPQNGNVYLDWEVKEVEEIDYFLLEKSTAQGKFSIFDTIFVKQTEPSKLFYGYDFSPDSGEIHYRLREVRLEQGYRFSSIEEVQIAATGKIGGAIVWPNPFDDQTHLKLFAKEELTIMVIVSDASGRRLFSEWIELNAGVHEKSIDLSHLSEGIYFFSGIDPVSGEGFSFHIWKK
ncbi:MAG: T9SS type A sorting domain-containing protein [Bacteroidota bacterium]